MRSAVYSFLAVSIMLMLVGVPVVSAVTSNDVTSKTITVRLNPGNSDVTSSFVNIGDENNITREADEIYSYLPSGTEGRYWGPYLKSSLFQFNVGNGYLQMAQNFSIGSETIMNGASEAWLRVPVDPVQFAWWHVYINWDVLAGYAGIGYDVYGMSVSDQGKLVMPWGYDEIQQGFGATGNYWSLTEDESNEVLATAYGIFIHLRGTFLPDQAFTVSFTGKIKQYYAPQVYMTQELLDETNYTYRFFNLKTLYGHSTGFSYDNSYKLPLMPAWAFVFVSGIGKAGMSAFVLNFEQDGQHNSSIVLGQGIPEYLPLGGLSVLQTRGGGDNGNIGLNASNHHITIFLPYDVVNVNDTTDASMDWYIECAIVYPSGGSTTFANGSLWCNFTCRSYVNYLLVTVPDGVVNPDADTNISVVLYPLYPAHIRFLAYQPNPGTATNYYTDPKNDYPIYHHIGYNFSIPVSWEEPITIDSRDWVNDANHLPIAYSLIATAGIEAQVHEENGMTVYDFGWGKGYTYPGSTNIYVFLDNGGQYMYHGNYQDFVEFTNDPINNWINQLPYPLNEIAGFIYDGITWVWDTIKSVGEWIYNKITEVFDIIASIIMDVASKVYDIVVGITYGLPIIFTLFIVNYAGSMLMTGRFQRPKRESRLAKKAYRGMVKKPVATAKQANAKYNPVEQRRKWRQEEYERNKGTYQRDIQRTRRSDERQLKRDQKYAGEYREKVRSERQEQGNQAQSRYKDWKNQRGRRY